MKLSLLNSVPVKRPIDAFEGKTDDYSPDMTFKDEVLNAPPTGNRD